MHLHTSVYVNKSIFACIPLNPDILIEFILKRSIKCICK